MNNLLSFLLGFCVGSIVIYFSIIYYAKNMEKDKKDLAIKKAKAKWK